MAISITYPKGAEKVSHNGKVAIIVAVTLLFAVATGWFFNNLLYGAAPAANGLLLWAVLAVLVLFLVVCLGMDILFLESKINYGIFLAVILALIFPLIVRLNVYQWLAALVLFLWLVFAQWKAKDDLKLLVKPKAGRILRRGIKMILGGFVIFAAVFYFFSPKFMEAENLFPPKSVFGAVLVPLEKLVQNFAPTFRKDMTVDDVILAILAGPGIDQLLKSDPDLKKLPPEEFEKLKADYIEKNKKDILAKSRGELSKQFEVSLQGDEKVADVFYDLALAQFKKLPPQIKTILGVLFAIGIYFTLKLAAIPFGWLVRIVSGLLVKLMLATKFAATKKEMIEREILKI